MTFRVCSPQEACNGPSDGMVIVPFKATQTVSINAKVYVRYGENYIFRLHLINDVTNATFNLWPEITAWRYRKNRKLKLILKAWLL